jgi:hypothetical protein
MSRWASTKGERALVTGYDHRVRLAGTAIICIVAAFGAAFLVARAVKHPTPARAATTSLKTTRVADAVTTSTTSNHQDAELLAQFSPQKAKLKPRPKPKPKHKAKKASPSTPATPSAPAETTPTDTTPAYTAPTYTTPTPVTPAPTHSSGSTHKKSGGGSSGGSGTTTIGG